VCSRSSGRVAWRSSHPRRVNDEQPGGRAGCHTGEMPSVALECSLAPPSPWIPIASSLARSRPLSQQQRSTYPSHTPLTLFAPFTLSLPPRIMSASRLISRSLARPGSQVRNLRKPVRRKACNIYPLSHWSIFHLRPTHHSPSMHAWMHGSGELHVFKLTRSPRSPERSRPPSRLADMPTR
jgi:hypothetical protein